MDRIEIREAKRAADVLASIQDGLAALSPDDEVVLRRYGIYTQRPAEDGFFMVRIRIPRGQLAPVQLRAIADLANEYGRGLADITVRQNIQLHWVRFENLPSILDRLSTVGLSTTEPSTGCVRNIVTCPVSGVDEDELFDATDLAREIGDFFADNPLFTTMPRKLKITITGCAVRCVYPEINDIGIFAIPDFERGGIAFRARVGGGLSIKPRFSQDLGILFGPDEVVAVCGAIAAVFRDQDENEDSRRGRVRYLVEKWQIPGFRSQVEARLGYKLRRAGEDEAAPVGERDRSHAGIHGQHESGLYYVGLSVLAGRTSGDQLNRLAALSEEYASGRVRTTNTQNITLLDIPEWNLRALARELELTGFEYEPGWARKGVIACSGAQFCKLALTETKNRVEELTRHLEEAVDIDDPVRISVTGCPNSCGQHHICDVGLEGSLTTIDGVKHESFQVLLGGGVGRHQSFSRRIGLHISSAELAASLARLFTRYKEDRSEGETFQEFCMRHSDEELVEYLLPPASPVSLQFGGASTEQLSP